MTPSGKAYSIKYFRFHAHCLVVHWSKRFQSYENFLEFSLDNFYVNVFFLYETCVNWARSERWGQGRQEPDGRETSFEEQWPLGSTGGHLSRVRDGRHGMTETLRNPGVRSLKHDDLSLPEPRRSNPSPEINGRQHKVCLTYIVKLWENFAGHFREWQFLLDSLSIEYEATFFFLFTSRPVCPVTLIHATERVAYDGANVFIMVPCYPGCYTWSQSPFKLGLMYVQIHTTKYTNNSGGSRARVTWLPYHFDNCSTVIFYCTV